MNEIFDKLIKAKIEKFVLEFNGLSRQLFVDENGILRHPGEFGMYRERIVKAILEPFLPTRLGIGSGFIITSENHISTQCDIIIYDKENTPIIETEEQRFFPVECVVGVFEIKSKLTKSQLKDALIKLTNIKKLRADINTNTYIYRPRNNKGDYDCVKKVTDQIATFLICESIDFDIKKEFNSFFKKTYKDTDKSLFHNMILSLTDGCFLYNDGTFPIYYPYYSYEQQFKNQIIVAHAIGYKWEHILIFINYFYMIISDIAVLFLEITLYLGQKRIKSSLIED